MHHGLRLHAPEQHVSALISELEAAAERPDGRPGPEHRAFQQPTRSRIEAHGAARERRAHVFALDGDVVADGPAKAALSVEGELIPVQEAFAATERKANA